VTGFLGHDAVFQDLAQVPRERLGEIGFRYWFGSIPGLDHPTEGNSREAVPRFVQDRPSANIYPDTFRIRDAANGVK